MSESTTKSTKTTKSESKTAKPESKSTSTSGDATSAKSADSTSAKSDSAPSEKSTKGTAAADNSPSYFSSVSTPEYRNGWDSVFSSSKSRKTAATKPRRAPAKAKAKAKNGLPVTIELDPAELDDDVRAVIEDAFRRKAKKKRVKFDQFMKKAQVTWRLECQFTD
ncbi:MAG: hypothetical protein VCD33_00175 [Alphaproteobacteria bacterium]